MATSLGQDPPQKPKQKDLDRLLRPKAFEEADEALKQIQARTKVAADIADKQTKTAQGQLEIKMNALTLSNAAKDAEINQEIQQAQLAQLKSDSQLSQAQSRAQELMLGQEVEESLGIPADEFMGSLNSGLFDVNPEDRALVFPGDPLASPGEGRSDLLALSRSELEPNIVSQTLGIPFDFFSGLLSPFGIDIPTGLETFGSEPGFDETARRARILQGLEIGDASLAQQQQDAFLSEQKAGFSQALDIEKLKLQTIDTETRRIQATKEPPDPSAIQTFERDIQTRIGTKLLGLGINTANTLKVSGNALNAISSSEILSDEQIQGLPPEEREKAKTKNTQAYQKGIAAVIAENPHVTPGIFADALDEISNDLASSAVAKTEGAATGLLGLTEDIQGAEVNRRIIGRMQAMSAVARALEKEQGDAEIRALVNDTNVRAKLFAIDEVSGNGLGRELISLRDGMRFLATKLGLSGPLYSHEAEAIFERSIAGEVGVLGGGDVFGGLRPPKNRIFLATKLVKGMIQKVGSGAIGGDPRQLELVRQELAKGLTLQGFTDNIFESKK